MISTTIRYKNIPVGCITELIGEYSDADLASPYRSTVPLLALIKDDQPLFDRIVRACGIETAEAVSFEHEVHSASEVRGLPSCTDAMVFGGDHALAIEAKWTEPRYETVASRLVPPKRITDPELRQVWRNEQRQFVAGWLEHLRRRCPERPLTLDDVNGCVYQVIHRAASACDSGKRPALLYLHFAAPHRRSNAATTAMYQDDLCALHGLLGRPSGFPFFVAEVEMTPTAAFERISTWRPGAEGTGAAVREALLNERLFEFGEPEIKQIG